ncbi:hypothetical protein ACKWTF_000394 [Chironomus riparius]
MNLKAIAKKCISSRKYFKQKKFFNAKNFKVSIWCVAYTASFFGLAVYVQQAYFKWNIDPDIGINPKLISSNDIPALALTVCSPVAIKDGFVNSLEYFLQYIDFADDGRKKGAPKKLTVKEKNYLAAVSQACGSYFTSYGLENDTMGRDEKDIIKLLNEASVKINDTFFLCVKQLDKVNCEDVLKLILTHDGFCYTHNMIDFYEIFNEDVISSDFDSYKLESSSYIPNQWTLNRGYQTPEGIFPDRAAYGNSFKLLMSINESNTDLCKERREGFKVTYHLPNEIPTVFHDHDYIGFQRKLIVEIKPQVYSMDPTLQKFSVDKRKCYFDGERKLKFFKAYTKVQCNLECLTNYTLHTCGCVQFSMPRTQNTPICDIDMMKCFQNAARNWPKNDPMSNNSIAPCECYPPCRDIRYEIAGKTHDLSEKNSLTLKHYQKGNNTPKLFSLIHIKYSKFQVEEMESFVVYKLQNFVAECGGLLGLFMGISFMSIIQMIIKAIERIITKDNEEFNKEDITEKEKNVLSPERSKSKYEYNLSHGMRMIKPAAKNQSSIYTTPYSIAKFTPVQIYGQAGSKVSSYSN